MSVLVCLIVVALSPQITAIRPIEKPPERPQAQEPHLKVLPPEIGVMMLGTYTLDKPWSNGATELAVSIVDDKVRLRLGEAERMLIYERLGTETIDGVKAADVYGFTVVGMPGVQIQFKVLNNRVQYVNVFDDFAKPPVVATGRPKRR